MMYKKTTIVILRLLRPLFHLFLIGFLFVGAYWLRLRTDLIPGLQIRIPPIIVDELWLFASVVMLFFVLAALRNGLYKLRGVPRYRSLFIKTR